MKGKWLAVHSCRGESEEFKTLELAKKWLKDLYADDVKYGECYEHDSCTGFDFIARITHRSSYIVKETKEDYPCALGICSYCVGSGQCMDCPANCSHEDPWPHNDAYDEVGDIQLVRQDEGDVLGVLEIVKREFEDLETRTTVSRHAKDAVMTALKRARGDE